MQLSKIKERIISVKTTENGKIYTLYVNVPEDTLKRILENIDSPEDLDKRFQRISQIDARELKSMIIDAIREVMPQIQEKIKVRSKQDKGVDLDLPDLKEADGGSEEKSERGVVSLEEAIANAVIVVLDENM